MTILKYRNVLLLLLVSIVSSPHADELHYNNILIGDRASGLGGAYTAISDDATGLYYNPAGIVFSEDLQISATANAYHTTEMTYKDVLNGGDWKRKSENVVPNYFGMTTKLGDGYVGFSYAVPEFASEDQDSEFTSIPGVSLFVININNEDKVTKIGPSYAINLNEQWDIGITLYYYERRAELTNNQFIRLPNNQFESSNLYYESNEYGYEPVLGLMWSPNDTMSVGLSIRKTYLTSANSRTQVTCISDVNNPSLQPSQCISVGGSPADPTTTKSNSKRDLPLNVRVGVAYFPTPQLLYTADISYYEEVGSSTFDAEEVINYALGIEYYFTAEWAIRGGYYTNESNAPEVSSGKLNQTDHVDLDGVSLSITRFSKTSSITLGYSYASGDGEAQVITGSPEIQDLEQTIETVYLSTAYHF
jgi:long-subunit fatty acid transport protein